MSKIKSKSITHCIIIKTLNLSSYNKIQRIYNYNLQNKMCINHNHNIIINEN